MPEQVDDLLASVIRITKERDKKSLERVLVETLADFIKSEAIIMLRMSPGGTSLEESVSIPEEACQNCFKIITGHFGEQHIEQDQGVSRCINNNEIVYTTDADTTRTLYPIETNSKVSGVLAIHGHKRSEHSDALIRGFLKIYCNFLDILNDNERDTLTGLLNRKTFDSRITELLSIARKDNYAPNKSERRNPNTDKSHWLGILDIDHFKKINDTYGHIYGDEVLLLFSDLMKQVFRNSDLLFRYGGEEFVVVLSPTNVADAMQAFERFRHQLSLQNFPQVGHVTTSIGMVKISSQDHPTTVVEHADKALYYAKGHGRNQTCNYHQLIENGLLEARRSKDDIELF